RHGCAAPKGSPWHQGGARSARAVRGAARSKPSKARSVASEPCERSEATMPHCGLLSAKLTEGFFDPSVTAYAVPPFLSSAWSPCYATACKSPLLIGLPLRLFRALRAAKLRPTGRALRAPLFPSGKRRLWGSAASYGVPLPKKAPLCKGDERGGAASGCNSRR